MATASIDIVLSNGKKAGETLKELFKDANKLNKEIKDLKPGTEEFAKKSQDLRAVNSRIKDIKKEAYGTSQGMKELTGSMASMLPFGNKLQGLTGSFNMLKGGVGGVTKGTQLLKVALMGLGIGLIIAAIQTLVTWLTKTQAGMEFVQKVSAAVGATFDVLINRSEKLVGAFKSFFSGNFGEGFDQLKESVAGVGTEIAEQTELAWRLKDAMISLEKSETSFQLLQAQRKRQIAELILQTRDQTLSYEARARALEQANQLEKANLQDALALQRERVRIMQEEFDNGTRLEEQRKALVAERVKLEQLETDSFNRQRELVNRMTELRNKQRADEAKLERERLEAIENQKQAELELMQLIEEAGRAERETLEEELERIKVLRETNHLEKLTEMELQYAEEQAQIETQTADRLLTEEERQIALMELEKQYLEQRLKQVVAYYGAESKEAREMLVELQLFQASMKKEETKTALEQAEEQKGINEAKLGAILGASQQAFGNLKQLFDEGSSAYQAAAFFEGQIAVIRAGLEAFKFGNSIGGPIVGGILAAITVAAGEIQLAKIRDAKKAKAEKGMFIDSTGTPQKYSVGGMLQGALHSSGGIPGIVSSSGQPIEMEDGEIILNRRVSQDPRGLAMASELNAMYGGIRFFENGGPISLGAMGAGAVAAMQGSVMDPGIGEKIDQLITVTVNQNARIDSWQRSLQVNNNLQETRNGIDVLNDLQDQADF